MALLPSIMSLFNGGTSPATAAANPQPGQSPAATPASQTAAAGANPTVPSATTVRSDGSVVAIPPAATGTASPLAEYADIWKADANAPKPTSLTPTYNLDPKGLREAAAKIDFTGHIDKALVTKALSGGADAAEALLQVISQSSQMAYAQGAATSAELTRQSLDKAGGVLTDTLLPQALRNNQISKALDASNPIFQDPAVSPVLDMIRNQFAAKNPTATPEAVATAANNYFAAISGKYLEATGATIVPKTAQVQKNGLAVAKDVDWENFFELG